MKRIIILFMLLALTLQFSYSQNIRELDVKNGFKSYKLGTSKSEIQRTLRLELLDNGKYRVLNNPDNLVFDLEVQEVWLGFDTSDKLITIFIIIKKGEQGGKIGLMGSYFNSIFGRYTDGGMLNEKDGYEIWKGEKVILFVVYKYAGLNYNWQSQILITTKDNFEKGVSSGF